jgi:hypothetical protein
MKEPGELTAEEAAPLLGVRSPETVIAYHQRGLLEGRSEWAGLVRRYYFTQAGIDRCLERLHEMRRG